jgi:hypothetical protein
MALVFSLILLTYISSMSSPSLAFGRVCRRGSHKYISIRVANPNYVLEIKFLADSDLVSASRKRSEDAPFVQVRTKICRSDSVETSNRTNTNGNKNVAVIG